MTCDCRRATVWYHNLCDIRDRDLEIWKYRKCGNKADVSNGKQSYDAMQEPRYLAGCLEDGSDDSC